MNPDKRRERKLAKRRAAKTNEHQGTRAEGAAPQRRDVASPQVSVPHQLNLLKEVASIIQRAQDGESRVVTLGDFVLFSTTTGDAWLLDHRDEVATCLLLGRKPQKYKITETKTAFRVEWKMQYQFDRDFFVLADSLGQSFVLSGYPVVEIQQAIANHVRLT